MKCVIDTDLTNQGTTICINDENICTTRQIVDVSFTAYAANKKYNESGYVAVGITSFDAEGNKKREYFTKDDNVSSQDYAGIGMTSVDKTGTTTTDSIIIDRDDIINYIGRNDNINLDSNNKTILVDKIISHCESNKIACVDSETLLKRSISSLQDKMSDLGLSSVES